VAAASAVRCSSSLSSGGGGDSGDGGAACAAAAAAAAALAGCGVCACVRGAAPRGGGDAYRAASAEALSSLQLP
jgi:hypothetical protein